MDSEGSLCVVLYAFVCAHACPLTPPHTQRHKGHELKKKWGDIRVRHREGRAEMM